VDIPFPMNVRDSLIAQGKVHPHHVLPESGWISFYIRNENDVDGAIELLQRSYVITVESYKKKSGIY
jgi:hypothetical protein